MNPDISIHYIKNEIFEKEYKMPIFSCHKIYNEYV